MSKFIKPFRMGDVVKVIRDEIFNGINIIDDVHINGINDYEYSTDRGAWIDHRDMKLIRECDEVSMKQLMKSKKDEEEAYDDEGEDE